MPKNSKKELPKFVWPEVELGNWAGEFANRPTGSTGHHVQPGPPEGSVEFTYLIVGAAIIAPLTKMRWPAVVSFWVRTPFTPERIEAGFMFKSENMPTFNLGLEVTRAQFTETLWLFKEKLLNNFHFDVGAGSENHWPIKSWGATFEL
ncbi:hypothetical protein [Rhizobium leguminosarum]|uniref:hypothetical protein n=1 Tax=Rhizobium leguminosarum TaxID=384 RepID=UPI0010302CD8|nr:hypothetical protein [Rhizobium leguminosarum]TAV74741.1 hypothetical protein ELI28_14935 [Rhizobium leguminosarum]TAV79340.1 hypothetical protein ELI27_14925 [Rhizobium leguminosarum]